MDIRCDKCGRVIEAEAEPDTFLNAYGVLMCEECYDEYLFTDEGKVEVIIGIATGENNPAEFDADYLGDCICKWTRFRDQLDISDEEILFIEQEFNRRTA